MKSWKRAILAAGILGAAGMLAACASKDDPAPANNSPAPAPLPAGTVGTAGGTVTGPGGSQVVIPAGALAQNTVIEITTAATAAPALPANVTAIGPVLAFTPHGAAFATNATVTVPFDPALLPAGTQPVLYKTDAQSNWQQVSGAQVSGATMTAPVNGFSYFVVTTPPVTLASLTRSWAFDGIGRHRGSTELDSDFNFDLVELHEVLPIGLKRFAMFSDTDALVSVYSNANGSTYYATADAPAEEPGPDGLVGSETLFAQTQSFRKNAADATLRVRITGLDLNGADFDPRNNETTGWKIWSSAEIQLYAYVPDPNATNIRKISKHYSGVVLVGHYGSWERYPFSRVGPPLFDDSNVTLSDTPMELGPAGAQAMLNRDVVVDIPLDSVLVNETVNLLAIVQVRAIDLAQRESTASAYLRDPQGLGGEVIHTGLEPVGATVAPASAFAVEAAPSCSGPARPEAGTLQLSSAGLAIKEAGGMYQMVTVTRSGGTEGDVSVRVSTGGGSASVGSDYTAVTDVIRFDDREGGARSIFIPIAADALEEEDETVQLTLSDVRGCAALGVQTSATLTILDDDRPASTPPTRVVGGSVAGLVGTGLVIEEYHSRQQLTPGNGAFQFPLAFPELAAYEVRVAIQPTNPVQTCAVTNPGGTISGQDVTNIEVTCAPPATRGALDPAFGDGGRVVLNDRQAAEAVALQADGKILIVSEGAQLLRLNADGSPDTSFGNGGIVEVNFTSDRSEDALAVAVQADQRIVVAGTTAVNRQDDFGVARFNVDGTPDLTFGDHGRVVVAGIDDRVEAERTIRGSADEANEILIQPDGKLVITGYASMILHEGGTTRPFRLFAAIRLNTDGSLDTTFHSGRVFHGLGPDDITEGLAAVLQPDGKIVVGGSSYNISGYTDLGLARFNADGTTDTPFGNGGDYTQHSVSDRFDEIHDLAIAPDGSLFAAVQANGGAQNQRKFGMVVFRNDGWPNATPSLPQSDGDDYAQAIALLPDGKLLLAGSFSSSTVDDYAVVRLNADGSPDPAFGTNGVVTVDFFGARDAGRDMVVQPDGKVVVAGYSRSGTQNVLSVIRLQN